MLEHLFHRKNVLFVSKNKNKSLAKNIHKYEIFGKNGPYLQQCNKNTILSFVFNIKIHISLKWFYMDI